MWAGQRVVSANTVRRYLVNGYGSQNARSQRSITLGIFCVLLLFCSACNSKGAAAETEKGQPQPVNPVEPTRPVGQTGDWQLVFEDDFTGSELDTDNWVTCHWWNDEGCTIASNDELEWYRPDNVFLRDGKLVLSARKESVTAPDGREFAYTSGMVSTGTDTYKSEAHKFTFKHVYVEMRARVPGGKGLWPALWLLPDDYESLPEIDVMEILGDKPNELHMNFHYLDDEGNRNSEGHTWTSPEPLTDWHVYGLDWQPRGITWYLDGNKRNHYTAEEKYVPDEPMYLIANLAVGGEWPGIPDADTTFPSDFEIDFIRVWMRN